MDLFAMTDLCASKSDARRLVQQGGARINERKIETIDEVIGTAWVEDGEMLLKAGKKRYFRVLIV